ncbi:MAG: mechanosensitive ion channel [Rhodospirillaceae bacterium]|nr:mechanosensitive ion channel [Rhodospirillaceae bacterium]
MTEAIRFWRMIRRRNVASLFLLMAGLGLFLGLAMAAPKTAAAQTAATTAAGPGPAELEALAATLEDEAARRQLIDHIRALVAVQQKQPESPIALPPDSLGAQLLAFLSQQVADISRSLFSALAFVNDAPNLLMWVWLQAESPEGRNRLLEIIVKVAVVIGIGMLAERFAHRLLARPRRAVEDRDTETLWLRFLLRLARAGIDLAAIVAFAAVAYSVLPLTGPNLTTQLVALGLINASLVARAVLLLARIALAPNTPSLRLVPLDDAASAYGFRWAHRLANTTVYGYFAAEASLLLGLPTGGRDFILKSVGLIVAGMLVFLILRQRTAVADWIRGRTAGGSPALAGLRRLRQRIADVWHILAIAYVVAIYAIWVLRVPGGFEFVLRGTGLTLATLVAARLLGQWVNRLFTREILLGSEIRRRFPTLQKRLNRHRDLFHSIVRSAINVFAALSILQAWGIGSLDWLLSDKGRNALGGAFNILLILLVALVLWDALNAMMERYLSQTASGDAARRLARAQTLMPLVRRIVFAVIATFVTLMVLSEIGVNIAPLLAGAGAIGLAIGFGAQNLIKDLLSGVSLLMEDVIAVGDVVDLDGHAGVVEAMSIRSIRLRDEAGTVHTVPFSAVTTVRNMTKDFAFAVIQIGVGYQEDYEAVSALICAVGDGLRADPVFAAQILAPTEMVGIDSFGDSSVIVKARIKTRPAQQWNVTREFRRRLKKAFDERGVAFASGPRTVRIVITPEPAAPALPTPSAAR